MTADFKENPKQRGGVIAVVVVEGRALGGTAQHRSTDRPTNILPFGAPKRPARDFPVKIHPTFIAAISHHNYT